MQAIFEEDNKSILMLMELFRQSPSSWEGWRCLHIELHGHRLKDNVWRVQSDITGIMNSFFGDIEGTVYFCGKNNIYFFSKDARKEVMTEAGNIISAFVTGSGGAMSVGAAVWDIAGNEEGKPVNRAKRVLLVEDDRVMRELVRTTLRKRSDLMMATTAGQAIALYNVFGPDLILLDINLPDKKGDAVLNHIMRCDPRANVVIFSSQDSMETMVSFLERGASGFIAKPFFRNKLLRYVAA